MLDEALDPLEDPSATGNATLFLSPSPPTDPRDPRVFLRVLVVIFLFSIIDFDRTVDRMLNVLPTIDAPRPILFDVFFDGRDGDGAGDGPQGLGVAEGMHSLSAISDVSIPGSCTPLVLLFSSSRPLTLVTKPEDGESDAFSMLFASDELRLLSLSLSLLSWSVTDDEVGAHESLLDSTSLTMLMVCGRGRR